MLASAAVERILASWEGSPGGSAALPDGQITPHPGQAPVAKTFSFTEIRICRIGASSRPTKGAVVRRHERGRGCGGRDPASARRGVQGGRRIEPNPVSASRWRVTNGAGAHGKTVWSWLSLLQSSFAEAQARKTG